MNFLVLPPEINSALMLAGAGPAPLLEAAAAWDGLAAELGSAAVSFSSVSSGLVGGPWQGASAVAMAAAAAPYAGWLSASAAAAETAAGQARMMVSAFEAALAATVDPMLISANRSKLVVLALSNLFGQNTPAIAAAELDYELMWAQDVAAMAAYHMDAAAVVSALQAFRQPAKTLVAGLKVNAGLGEIGWTGTGQPDIASLHAGIGNFGDLAAPGTGFANAGSFSAASLGQWNLGNLFTGFPNAGNASDLLGLFPITLPLNLDVTGGIGPITVPPIHILPTIPLNFHQTFLLDPLTSPPIHVPAIPLVDMTIPIDIGPLTVPPITLIPAAHIPSQTLHIPAFNFVPGGIFMSGLFMGTLRAWPIDIGLHVNPTTVDVGLSTPAVTLFPGGLHIPDHPIHLDVVLSAGTGAFTIPGFSLPEHPIPLTISTTGQIDAFSTPAITIGAIPAHLHAAVTADRVVPLFPLPTIPLHIDINGTVGSLDVPPISIPAAHAAITNATVSLGSFTLPDITLPQIPITATGIVSLAPNTISPTPVLNPLNFTGHLNIGNVTGPTVKIGKFIFDFDTSSGSPSIVVNDGFNISLGIIPQGPISFDVGTTALTVPEISVPGQTPVAVGLTGSINPISLFPGGLTFPVNSASLVDFSVGSDPFTIFPNGFRVDQFPFNIHSEVLSPTPGTTGSIGPIHIPAVLAIPPIHLGGTGHIELNLGVPPIPIPAVGLGLDGNANYGFLTDAIHISPFGVTGDLVIDKINLHLNFAQFDLGFHVPAVPLSVAGDVTAFTISQTIAEMTVPLDFTTPPLTIPALSLSGFEPLNIPLNILTPSTVPAISHIQSIPIEFAYDTPKIDIPDITIPAIPIDATTANLGGAALAGLLNAVAANVANAGPQLSTAANAGAAWLADQLMNAGLGNTGIANLGSGNLGSLNFGDGNIGSYNLGGGNIGVANVGWGNSSFGALMGNNFGFGNSGSGNVGFGNTGVGNIGFGNTGTGNTGIGLIGENLSGFGGWNAGNGNVGLFNSGTGNWGLFNSGTGNSGIGNSGQANTGVFNSGAFNAGLANAGAYNTGIFNAGHANAGAFNPGHLNTGVFNSGNANVGVANSGNANAGVLISGNHNLGALFAGDYQGRLGAGLNIFDINENLGPIHIDPIHVPGMPIDVDEAFTISPFTIPQIDVPAIPVDVHQSLTLPAITVFEGLHVPAQHITIPFGIPASTGSILQLPVIHWHAATSFESISFNPQDFYIGQTSNPTSPSGQPAVGITLHTLESGAKSGSIALNVPKIDIPKIATSPLPLNIDVTGGIPAFTLFPGGLSLPEQPIPVNLGISGGLQPFTIFPDGYTIDPIPLHLRLDATLLNPFDGVPPSLNLVDFHLSGGMGAVTVPDIPIPDIQLGLNGHLDHGAFTIPPIPIPDIPLHVTGNIGLGPIGIPSVHIPEIAAHPLAAIHFNASENAVMRISPFYIWSPSNAPWDPVSTGPTFVAFGSDFGDGIFPLPQGPLIFGSSTQDPFSVTINARTVAFDTPAVLIHKIPLNFDVPGSVSGGTLFPDGLTFPANSLLNLNLAAGSGAFTIPEVTIPAIPADVHALVKIATPNNLLPPYNLLHITATGGVGPVEFPSFHIPSIPLGANLGGGIGPITIPAFSTPPIHLGLDPTAIAGPVGVEPFSINPLGLHLAFSVSDITSGASTSTGAFRLSGIAGAIINIGGTSSGGTIQGFDIPGFLVQTPPGAGVPGFTIPVDPIHLSVPLSATIPSLTFPGLTIPHIPLGLGLSGALPAFDLPSIRINRIPINFSGPLNLL